ncbi:MAG: hypothetical protein ACTHW2_06030 [Tissierella sp.]|uniref:hypothetical protein n=1 Tax=Tissierella sp. TaxID=41274 RepID=UPI003F9AE7C5
MNHNSPCYNKISIDMLELLTDFSDSINQITVLNDFLLTEDLFSKNSNFTQYLYYFDMGRYYHFRCMGYMEALVLTKCYCVKSLCYWKTKLVMPASKNINLALNYLNKLKSNPNLSCNPTFQALIVETEELMEIAMEIMDLIKCYDLPC